MTGTNARRQTIAIFSALENAVSLQVRFTGRYPRGVKVGLGRDKAEWPSGRGMEGSALVLQVVPTRPTPSPSVHPSVPPLLGHSLPLCPSSSIHPFLIAFDSPRATDLQEKELGVGLENGIVVDDEVFITDGSTARVKKKNPAASNQAPLPAKTYGPKPLDDPETTWLIAPERARRGPSGPPAEPTHSNQAPSPAKTYVPKPSRLKPPTRKMNYFAQAPTAAPEHDLPKEEGSDSDSPFTRRIKALERDPALAFAGSSKLRNDDEDGVNAAGGRAATGHRDNPRQTKKKTAAELQVRVSLCRYVVHRSSSPIARRPPPTVGVLGHGGPDFLARQRWTLLSWELEELEEER